MSVGVYMHPRGMTTAQYDEVHAALEAAGASEPEGRTFHACFGDDGQLMVFDVWETADQFKAFAPTLGPLLVAAGVQMGPPAILPLHSIATAAPVTS